MKLGNKKNFIIITISLIVWGATELFLFRDFFSLSNAVAMEEKWRFEYLVSQGADVDEITCRTWGTACFTPLTFAILNDNKYFVKRLLELGADPNIPKSYRPITIALYDDKVESVDLLLKYGAKLINFNGNQDYFSVLSADNPYYIKLLLEQHEISPEKLFCRVSDQYNILKYLLETGVHPDYICNSGLNIPNECSTSVSYSRHTKLYDVSDIDGFAGNNSAKITQLLIDHGADINFRDDCNNTPLHYAAEHGANHVVKTLLENKSATHIINCDGLTAYELAQKKEQKWVLKAFNDYNQSRKNSSIDNMNIFE